MSGKPKQGIDFAGWNTDIFENDTKIDALIDDQGWIGFCIYFYLCQKAYASDGYFYRWSYANAPTTARRMGGGISSGTVKSAVGTCSREGLFNKRLLDEHGILTSRGIQRRFIAAIQKRSYRAVDRRFWLLSESETAAGKITFLQEDFPGAGDSRTIKAHVLPEDAHVLPENAPNSKVKESNYGGGGGNTRTREENDFARAISYYMDRIQPMPPTMVTSELKDYANALGAELCVHAMEVALAERKTQWSFIRAILERYKRDGLKSIGDVLEDERRHEERRAGKPRQSGGQKKKTFLDMYEEELNK